MTPTTTVAVPAIYALSGLGITMMMVAVYLVIIFLAIAAILFPLVFLAKKLLALMHFYD